MVPLSPYPPSCSPCAHTLFYPPEKKRIQLLGNRLCALRGCFSLEKVSSRHGEWGSGTDGCLTADRQHWLSSLKHWPPSSSVFPPLLYSVAFLANSLARKLLYLLTSLYALSSGIFFLLPPAFSSPCPKYPTQHQVLSRHLSPPNTYY